MISSVSDARMIVFLFDTGKIDDSFYGKVVFGNLVLGKEILLNPGKTILSQGDLFGNGIYTDVSPFIIRDDICTIKRNEHYENVLYGVLIEDITANIAIDIDQRMKQDFPAYIGMTSINTKSSDSRKQFWKLFIRSYSIELETITVFGTKEQAPFLYRAEAEKYGFRINYDEFDGYYHDKTGQLFSTRQSSFIQSYKQLEIVHGESDSDRGLLEMNFSLVKEVNLAGVLIWKAIEDISLAHIPHKSEVFAGFAAVDYIFTSLYQASQGIERLLKIVIQLIMYAENDSSHSKEYEHQLYSHKHSSMVDFIARKVAFEQIQGCRRFINLLQDFYQSARYNRFRYSENDRIEIEMMQKLGDDIAENNYDIEIKHRYGKQLGKTAQEIYSLICDLARELDIYLYEINYQTHAPYALHSYHGVDLYETLMRIQHSKRELLWHLIIKEPSLKMKEASAEFPPVEFSDVYDISELTESLINGENSAAVFGYVDNYYDNLYAENKSNWQSRINFIDSIAHPSTFSFDENDPDDV